MATSQRYPVGKKIRRNRFILHGFQDISIFKMAAIFVETEIFRKMRWLICSDTLWVKNFVKITLSRNVFEIQAFFCFPYLEN